MGITRCNLFIFLCSLNLHNGTFVASIILVGRENPGPERMNYTWIIKNCLGKHYPAGTRRFCRNKGNMSMRGTRLSTLYDNNNIIIIVAMSA